MRKIVDLETVSTDIIQNSIYYIFFFTIPVCASQPYTRQKFWEKSKSESTISLLQLIWKSIKHAFVYLPKFFHIQLTENSIKILLKRSISPLHLLI